MYAKFFKRFLDFLLALIALIVLSPLLLILTVTGAIAMKGNPFFVQPRPGKINKKTGKEKIFKLIKFRTMTNEKDKNGKLLPDEKRLNAYGRALRKASLDELPEIILIVWGSLAIVGPRPLLVRDMVFMSLEQRKRHTVRPGLTGLAQINGRNNISWEKKLEYDLEYIADITFSGDFKIILKTVGQVFKRSDIAREGTVSDIDLGDWLLQNGKIDAAEYNNGIAAAKILLP